MMQEICLSRQDDNWRV